MTDFSGVGIREFSSSDTHPRQHGAVPARGFFLLHLLSWSASLRVDSARLSGATWYGRSYRGDDSVLQVGINVFGDNFAWRTAFVTPTRSSDHQHGRCLDKEGTGCAASGTRASLWPAHPAGVWSNYVRAHSNGIFVSSVVELAGTTSTRTISMAYRTPTAGPVERRRDGRHGQYRADENMGDEIACKDLRVGAVDRVRHQKCSLAGQAKCGPHRAPCRPCGCSLEFVLRVSQLALNAGESFGADHVAVKGVGGLISLRASS